MAGIAQGLFDMVAREPCKIAAREQPVESVEQFPPPLVALPLGKANHGLRAQIGIESRVALL